MSGKDLEDEYIGYLSRLDRQWHQTGWLIQSYLGANMGKGRRPPEIGSRKLLHGWPFAEKHKKRVRRSR
jgi:hypothetical protein